MNPAASAHLGDVLLVAGVAWLALAVLADAARGLPASGGVRTTGRLVLRVLGWLVRPPVRRRRRRTRPVVTLDEAVAAELRAAYAEPPVGPAPPSGVSTPRSRDPVR